MRARCHRDAQAGGQQAEDHATDEIGQCEEGVTVAESFGCFDHERAVSGEPADYSGAERQADAAADATVRAGSRQDFHQHPEQERADQVDGKCGPRQGCGCSREQGLEGGSGGGPSGGGGAD